MGMHATVISLAEPFSVLYVCDDVPGCYGVLHHRPCSSPVRSRFRASNLQIGAVIAGFALTRTAFNIPAGIFAGKVGSKKSMLLGLIFVGVTSAIIGLARNYETVLLARTIAGAGPRFTLHHR